MGWAENSKLYSIPYNISYGTRLQELQRQDFDRYAENMEYTEYKVEGYKPIQLKAEMPEGNGSFLKPKEDAIALEYDGKKQKRPEATVWQGSIFPFSMTYKICESYSPFTGVYVYNTYTTWCLCDAALTQWGAVEQRQRQ